MAAAWICGRGQHHWQRRHVGDAGCSAVRAAQNRCITHTSIFVCGGIPKMNEDEIFHLRRFLRALASARNKQSAPDVSPSTLATVFRMVFAPVSSHFTVGFG